MFHPSNVKNARQIEFELPPALVDLIDEHVTLSADLLCPGGTPWLFPRRDGAAAIEKSCFSRRISKTIRKETGLEGQSAPVPASLREDLPRCQSRALRSGAQAAGPCRAVVDAERLCRVRGRNCHAPVCRDHRSGAGGDAMRRMSLPFEDWPVADQLLWESLIAQGGPLDGSGALAHVKEKTRRGHRFGYGHWLAWLAMSELAALEELPAARASPERLRSCVAACSGLSPATRLFYLSSALHLLRAAAPAVDWRSHRRLPAVVRHLGIKTPRRRKAGRIRSCATLFKLGADLARPAVPAGDPASLGEARRRRDGAVIAFLSVMLFRHRAFCGLVLGQSILIGDRGKRIVLDPDIMKTGTWWEARVPASLEPILRDYSALLRDDT